MKRFAIGLFCALSLALAPACGGDDDGDTGDATDAPDVDSGGGGGDAEAFCTEYGTVCEFGGDGHADQAACVSAFNGYTSTRQTCVMDHLDLAAAEEDGSADEMMHCGHAAGLSVCT